ncbi:hypothetical protein COY26_00265 [Candidatus Woesearchaeota archaeon CG_4_10_14_0_2_um_filter_33_10]|nr:MAG: hypothetical protein COV14_03740 [Candidatus Woesearchaeota archaeon CG10_big_fil_rev_8_21_14_0_10_33_12]PIU72652.1 MAG: hypothetical protein COS79_01815 [Candidatus Woesearchaeota archaeon CG06_land_8_20_14_3_00_33_13]PIZ54022.1 MAG: hypothetical protein COY26_00265 [Candidatus Woesearchaeota archaeon CG_4_10_14_0_2_um_filter_33_10]
MEKNQNDAIVTFILEGNKETIKYGVENPSGKKELYICKGAVELNEKLIFVRPNPFYSLEKEVSDTNNPLTKGDEIAIRLSDLLNYHNLIKDNDTGLIKVRNAILSFNGFETIQRPAYMFSPSDFYLGSEQKVERGNQDERKRVKDLGYTTEGITLTTGDGSLDIIVNGIGFINQVKDYYDKEIKVNKFINLKFATAKISSNWDYNEDKILDKTKQEMLYEGFLLVNLKNFKRKIIL